MNDESQFSSSDSLQQPSLTEITVEVGELNLASRDPDEPALQNTVDETDGLMPEHDDVSDQQDNHENSETRTERPKRVHIPNKRIFNDEYVVNQAQLCKRDPDTVEEALKSPNAAEWQKAIENEIQAHTENGTWILSEVPTANWKKSNQVQVGVQNEVRC